MEMPGRSYTSGTGYRYGFNGKEKDTEGPVQYDYGFRIYDPRLVRFKSVDPLTKSFPYYTPYQFAGNSPIWAIDLDGLEDYVVVKELYKNGATKKISIQYTVKKDDVKSTINMQFKQLLGKNPDGTDKLGEPLTTQKAVRIIRDANKREKVEYGDLNKEEQAIKNQFSRNEMGNPTDDAWKLAVNGEKYTSGIDRDATTQQDKIAQKNFHLIKNLDQTLKNGAVPFYLPNDGTGKLVDEASYKQNSDERRFFSLPGQIKEDGGIKSININHTIYLSPDITADEMVGVNKSLENVKAQILSMYGTSATGVKNVTVNLQAVQTPDFQNKNKANPNPVKITLSR